MTEPNNTASGAADFTDIQYLEQMADHYASSPVPEIRAHQKRLRAIAAALASAAQPGADERRLRRILCARYEFLPYMDDGEAQGQKLDWLRCTVDQIEARILEVDHERFLASAAAPAEQPSEIENLRKALEFYAEGHHFILADETAWDTVSGEPQNFLCDEAGTATVEDGSFAKMVLDGLPFPEGDPEDATAPQPNTAYAELPGKEVPSYSKDAMYLTRASEMRAFADATYALRASRGQAPAVAADSVTAAAATVIKKGAERQWMSERLGHLPDGIYSLYLAPPTQAADSVLEDAARIKAAAVEREACAAECLRQAGLSVPSYDTAVACAAAIRARKQGGA